MVYLCSGTDSEKLEWLKTINIAGEKLTDQELRNAVYHGPWTADAKRYFSKTGCLAYGVASDYVYGSPITAWLGIHASARRIVSLLAWSPAKRLA